jgi:hypothetical protein
VTNDSTASHTASHATQAAAPHDSHAERATLQGLVATRADEAALLAALEQAFDYRGDVTLELTDGSRLSGYVYDRKSGPTLATSALRVMPENDAGRVTIPYDRIARIEFTGKDTAAGKSFDNWLKKYVEKKLAGQTASIESETLD